LPVPAANVTGSLANATIPAGNVRYTAIAATFATTVNDANPTGWGSTIARIQGTPASGGSTLNGLVSTGFVDGQSAWFINESAIDIFIFNNKNGASQAADQFFCPGATAVTLDVQAKVLMVRDNGYWTL
jgi:hypothetical protein